MKLFDIMINTRYELLQGKNVDIKNITIDSRFITKGELFFCIDGLHVNGHSFIQKAAEQGVAAIVVDQAQPSYPSGVTVLKVLNTRQTLAYAASNFFKNPTNTLQLVGVTGTNGKTSVVHFVEAIFSEWGKKTGVIGTVETRIGKQSLDIHFATSTTPDTVELFKILSKMHEEQVSHVAMEVSSHALALHKTDSLRYEVGIFTNLTQDHLDFHHTMDAYMQTKALLFQQCRYGIFNVDDPAGAFMMKHATCKTMTYSIDHDSELQARNVQYHAEGVEFDVLIGADLVHFTSPIPGKFTVYNTLAAIGAAAAFNIPVEIIQRALATMQGVPGRIQRVANHKGFGVIVDYAHTPDGLENIISAVRAFTSGKVITVFGCGGDRDKAKRPVMGKIAGGLSDFCILTSDNPRTEPPMGILDEVEVGVKPTGCGYLKLVDRKDAIFKAVAMAQKGDSIIIAGKGHENYQIFEHQTIDFDDCEVATEALNG